MKTNDREKKYRDELTDRIVKRNIYIKSKGLIKYPEITSEMITEKRRQILAWRENKANKQPKTVRTIYCKICGTEIPKGVYCSVECRKEKARQDSFKMNSSKKILKQRKCKECGNVFTPEYGNKRRVFCSDYCLEKSSHRIRRHKERAKLRLVKVETVDPIKVFMRDGWKCQLCHRKLNPQDKGTYKDTAPELDHIIPLAKGGEHSYRNTQCACRRCNAEKSSNERGQLIMFG